MAGDLESGGGEGETAGVVACGRRGRGGSAKWTESEEEGLMRIRRERHSRTFECRMSCSATTARLVSLARAGDEFRAFAEGFGIQLASF